MTWFSELMDRRAKRRAARHDTDNDVQHTRAWTGLYVVVAGDAAIAVAAITAVVIISHHTSSGAASHGGLDTSSMVSILSSAFTAIATMTTAYFGIKAATNTAQSSMNANNSNGNGSGNPPPAEPDPTTGQSGAT